MIQPLAFEPIRVMEVEIGQPLPGVCVSNDKTGRQYRRANCLVRLHSRPLGIVALQFDEHGVEPHELAGYIWCDLHVQINQHLQLDGLPPVTGLDEAGLPGCDRARCIEERTRFFENAPFVSIIIPTHDRPERIPECLRSLLALHYPHFEIVIVDNAPSSSATADFIRQTYADVAQVRYVREDHPGLSWAHNCGRKAARGEILAFTDDDVVVDPYWLIELVRGFSLAENVGCVTGLVLPLELETPAQLWFEEFGGFNKGFTRRVYDLGKNHPGTPLYPFTAGQFGTGANMAFIAAFLDSIGGFDAALGTGTPAQNGEDLAAFFQVVAGGHTLVYNPAALLYHLHRRDYPGLYKQIYTYGVGLTAYLTKTVFDNPLRLLGLMTRIPYGLYFTLGARSPKNKRKSAQYPAELTRVELKGMLYGPLAYVQSRRSTRHTAKVGRSGKSATAVLEKEN